jgi:hypothetical protein
MVTMMERYLRVVAIILGLLVLVFFTGCEEDEATLSDEIIVEYGAKPDTLPTFAQVDLYSDTSPFNTLIPDNPSIDANNEALVSKLAEGGDFLITVKRFSSPVYIATASTPRYDVYIPCGSAWELGLNCLLDVPIPDGAEPASDGEPGDPLPFGCGEGSDQDNHMVVLDLENRCEYDFWTARKTTEGWFANWASSISMDSDGVYPHGMSTRGSGLAFMGGVIWPDELHNGVIDHALSFNHPYTKSGGPVAPATDSDGEINQSNAIPEGALFQLNPDLDLGSLNLTPYELTVAVALQRYGMYLVDNGSSGIGLYAIDPKSVNGNPYEGVLPDEEWPLLSNIPLDEFRVIEMGPQNGNYQDELTPYENDCASYE